MATTRMVFNLVANDSASAAFDKLARNVDLSNAAIAKHNATAKSSTKALDDNAKSVDKNQSSLQKLSGTLTSSSSGFSKLGAALTFVPAAAASVGLLGGAAIGLGGAFGATALAAGAFGAVAVPILKDAGTAAKAVKTAQDTYTAAIASGTPKATAYKAEMLAINKAYGDMSPQQIALSKQLGGISGAWDKVKAAQTPVVSGALQPWLRAITPLMAALPVIIAKVAPVVAELGTKVDGIVKSAGFKAFIGFIAGTGSAGLKAAGGSILDLVSAFLIILPKFTPLFNSANDAIAKIGPAVLKWASSQKTADGIKSFMAWFYTNGPVLTTLLTNIGRTLALLAPGLAAGGVTELKLISDFFGLVARLPPNFAGPIAALAGSMLLLNKLGVLSVGVKLTGVLAGKALASSMLGRALLGDSLAAAGALVLPVTLTIAAITGLSQIHDKTGGGTLVAPTANDLGYNGRWARDISHWYDLVRHDVSVIWDLMWNNTVGRARRGIDDVFRWISSIRPGIASFFTGAVTWLVKPGGDTITGLWNGLKTGWATVTGWASRIWGWVTGWFSRSWTWLVGAGQDVITGAWNGLKTGWGWVTGWASRIYGWVTGWFSRSWTWLVGSGQNVIQGLWNGLAGRWANVSGWFGRIWGWVTGVFSGAGWWLFRAGQDVIQGLWNGLVFIWNKVTGWISGLAGWIKRNKGPISLDRSLLEPAGRAIMTGLRVGLLGGWVGIQDIVSGIAGNIGNSFSGLFSLGGKIGGFLSNLFGGSAGTAGSGVQRWRSTVLQALAMEGLPASLAGNVLYQMQTESGGDPNVVNRWDSNAAAGHPSQGLMQVIPGTFAAFHVAGTSWNILNPLANIAAAIAYSAHGRGFGSGPGQMGSGHGYALGSWDVPVTGPATVHQGEMILPAQLAAAVRSAIGSGSQGNLERLLKQLIAVSAAQGEQFARALDGAARHARAY